MKTKTSSTSTCSECRCHGRVCVNKDGVRVFVPCPKCGGTGNAQPAVK